MQVTRFALVVALLLVASVAQADDLPEAPPSERCRVISKCSATGIECGPNDEPCKERAREKGLEITCETKAGRLVYCPPLTGHADSKAIWFLLAAAVTLAVGGTAVAWHLLRSSKVVKPEDDAPTKAP